MTRLSKIAPALLFAFLPCAIFYAAVHPRPLDALSGRSLDSDLHGPSHTSLVSRPKNLPAVIFWAWERHEDLRFLTPDQAGVAFLAKTIFLEPSPADSFINSPSFLVRPRLQPLRITPGTPLIAVVRIEPPSRSLRQVSLSQFVSLSQPNFNSPAFREKLASEIAGMQSIPGVAAVQIDFDAPASAHSFYAALLQDVRRKLRPSLPLSITALASWCIGDPWLLQLPPGTVDEAVPMLFRMGPDAANVAQFLHSHHNFLVAACRGSLGLSTDETLSQDLLTAESPAIFDSRAKCIYIFAPRAWTASAATKILKELQP